MPQALNWQAATCRYIEGQIEKGIQMTVQRMCGLGQVSRAGFYRFESDRESLDQIWICGTRSSGSPWSFLVSGCPRITAELKRRAWEVGHRRVGRIMREDNLLCLRRRKFVVATTDSNHNLRVYPNLAGSMTLTGIDQLWIAKTSHISGWKWSSFTWRWCSMHSHAGSSDGRWIAIWRTIWRLRRSKWPSAAAPRRKD